MSNLSEQSKLKPASAQLPVHAYFDEALLQQEQALLFKPGPNYVGHDLWVPEKGQYHSIPWEGHGRVLVRNEKGVELLSNVCKHRQAIMLKGSGRAENIVCPLHRWTYELNGELMGAPHFPEVKCSNLEKFPLQNWRGLNFSSTQNIAKTLTGTPYAELIDFSGYVLDKVVTHECNYNWKTFIEVYLEDYHVDPFHPGLGQFVDCANLQWHVGEQWSAQSVGIKAGLRRAGTPTYGKWHDAVTRFTGGKTPEYGAIWFCFYPNVMVEWYPHVLVVSTLHPNGPKRTTNVVEFYYPEEIALFEREFVEAEQAAYHETAVEDDEIAERMDEGRWALHQRGTSEVGPYQSPMEDGMLHFHEWFRRQMGNTI
ncbi:MAG: aromatic ring-hydroxylating dioxygenase subunit alpha [Burkholderiales bacterium]|nr:aromatic ring-hydroxylating dioxygenase subunit alpha [Burkholderiales bacterium]